MKLIKNLWHKKQFACIDWVIFVPLVCFELVYKFFFFCSQQIRKILGGYKSELRIISVGNISVGGTGKTVVVKYLANLLGKESAIILRGFGGSNEHTGNPCLVSDGSNVKTGVDVAGDEAILLARSTQSIVVVCKSRKKACKLIQKQFPQIKFIILDDAYQNYELKKDLEILILDANVPFSNGHCLPAGGLREKDVSRADIVLLSHATDTTRLDHTFKVPVLRIRHAPENLIPANRRIFAFAGVGNFHGFIDSLNKLNLNIAGKLEFPDHFNYYETTIDLLNDVAKKSDAEIFVTTQKDYVKLVEVKKSLNLPSYFLCVKIEFLFRDEEEIFTRLIKKSLK